VVRKRRFAIPMFIGFFIFFVTALHDGLYYTNVIRSIYFMPLGLFFATFSQAYVLAHKTTSAHVKSERLSEKLAEQNRSLENQVKIRTSEIESQKKEIEIKAGQLAKSNRELIKLANFKKNMTNMMIHDLKAPLNSIMGFAQINLDKSKYNHYILKSGWEMENLIQNILDVEMYDSPEFKLRLEETNIHELVNFTYENIYFILTSKNIAFKNNIPHHIKLNIDRNSIFRVFVNMFSNAAKYGGENIDLEVSCEEVIVNNQSYLKIKVFNSGKAIHRSKINIIFNMYNSENKDDIMASNSSGIGLTYCKLAINAHNGDIGVISDENSGVTFWFTIPK